jgi:hypothetical protein
MQQNKHLRYCSSHVVTLHHRDIEATKVVLKFEWKPKLRADKVNRLKLSSPAALPRPG